MTKMTKYQKTKKMMKETGLSKKECQKWLRAYNWDLDLAIRLSKIPKIDWSKAIDAVSKACHDLAEAVAKAFNQVDWAKIKETIKRIEEQEESTDERDASGIDQ